MQNKPFFLKETFKYVKGFVLALILVVGISYISASWSNPTTIAPGNNAPAPINVSGDAQVKLGGLSLGALLVSGGAKFENSVQITSGNPGNGRVLTSDSVGNARWAESASSESVPLGTMCGFKLWPAQKSNCQGVDPCISCPAGYTQRTSAVFGNDDPKSLCYCYKSQ